MRIAIDRLIIGKEEEIDIKDYDGNKKENRFVCPECGEYVFPAVGKKNSFKHHKKKEDNIENCDLRVDSLGNYTYYERVGLSLVLKKNKIGFSINILFPKLDDKLLNFGEKNNMDVVINSNNNSYSSRFNIDKYNFSSEISVLKEIEFSSLDSYNIIVKEPYLIEFGNKIDGFTNSGALFMYSEFGGKKIRKNDTIEVNREYFWLISSKDKTNIEGISKEEVSIIKMKDIEYRIYKIKIQPKGEKHFKVLSDFFWKELRVRLLYKKSKIIPIWPPVIDINDEKFAVELFENKFETCLLESDNKKPIVYRYYNKKCSEENIISSSYSNHFVKLYLSKIPTFFTIDRKYLANSLNISWKVFELSSKNNNNNIILINNKKIEEILEKGIEEIVTEISIKARKNIKCIIWNKYKNITKIDICKNKEEVIYLDKNWYEIWFLERDVIKYKINKKLNKKEKVKIRIDEEYLYYLINRYKYEEYIDIPRKYFGYIYLELMNINSTFFKNYIKYGKIQPTVLREIIRRSLDE